MLTHLQTTCTCAHAHACVHTYTTLRFKISEIGGEYIFSIVKHRLLTLLLWSFSNFLFPTSLVVKDILLKRIFKEANSLLLFISSVLIIECSHCINENWLFKCSLRRTGHEYR